jgi:predicted TPR repeat methyltransferase
LNVPGYADKNLLETATIKGLQDSLDENGRVDDEYLNDLKDVSDLKNIGDELGWDLSDLTVDRFHDILDEPLILERIVNDKTKKETANINKKRNNNNEEKIGVGKFTTQNILNNDANKMAKKREINLLRDKTYTENYAIEQEAEAHFQLGYMLHREGHLKSAMEEYEQCLKINKNHASAVHMLNAAKKNPVKKAEKSYVIDLFDYYAPNYDKHMVGVLKFKTPFLIYDAVTKIFESNNNSNNNKIKKKEATSKHFNETEMTILDLGCGTGLCGSLFEAPAHTLIGVDLSSSMATRAKALNVYEKVIVADVIAFAKNVVPNNKIDLVLLSDVLGYIGDVSDFFQDLSHSLRKNGMIALTIEVLKVEEGFCSNKENQYSLHTLHGRFRHCKQYVLDSLLRAGMHIVYNDHAQLRLQNRKGVKGQLIIGQKI